MGVCGPRDGGCGRGRWAYDRRVSDRWQDDLGRADHIRAWLDEVAAMRAQLDARTAEAAAGDLDRWMQRRAEDLAAGARKGLDASIWMALAAKVGVPPEEIARAAGVDLAYVEQVRARIGGR